MYVHIYTHTHIYNRRQWCALQPQLSSDWALFAILISMTNLNNGNNPSQPKQQVQQDRAQPTSLFHAGPSTQAVRIAGLSLAGLYRRSYTRNQKEGTPAHVLQESNYVLDSFSQLVTQTYPLSLHSPLFVRPDMYSMYVVAAAAAAARLASVTLGFSPFRQ